MNKTVAHISIAGALAVLGLVACGGDSEPSAQATQPTASTPASSALPEGSKPFEIDPREFTTEVTNPYWPMTVGAHWVYRETNAEGEVQRNDVIVTDQKKTVMGVDVLVVHDTVKLHGQLTEDTFDWYAQDSRGNLWYFGEDTTEYENGKPKTKEGSWEAGVDGALAGIIMPADPQVGLTYREEYYKGHAEDGASIIGLNGLAKVPYGRFENCVQTRNFSGIEPNVIEEKLYARGVGIILEITVSGGSDRAELLSYTPG
jgi:hypothetical protein